MAIRGTNKARSVDHENYVARAYRARRSPSSGGADTDKGDVRTPLSLIECKMTGGPGLAKQPQLPSLGKLVEWLDKAAEEAWEEGLTPVLALRYYSPGHRLANNDGWIDLALRLMIDDGDHDVLAGE